MGAPTQRTRSRSPRRGQLPTPTLTALGLAADARAEAYFAVRHERETLDRLELLVLESRRRLIEHQNELDARNWEFIYLNFVTHRGQPPYSNLQPSRTP